MADMMDLSSNELQVLGKRKVKKRTYSEPKRQCAVIDLQIPMDQSIVISPATPSKEPRSLEHSDPFSALHEEPADFEGMAVYRGQIIELSLQKLLQATDKWILLIFFPQPFTFSDPNQFIPFFHKKLICCCQVICCSHDSQFALLAWYNQFCSQVWQNYDTNSLFLLSDLNHNISKKFSKLNRKLEKQGNMDKISVVVLDSDGICKFCFTDFNPTGPRL